VTSRFLAGAAWVWVFTFLRPDIYKEMQEPALSPTMSSMFMTIGAYWIPLAEAAGGATALCTYWFEKVLDRLPWAI